MCILPQLLITEVLNDVLTGDKIIDRSGIEMVNSDYHIFNRETTNLIKQNVLQTIIRDNFMIKNNGRIHVSTSSTMGNDEKIS